MPQIDLDQLKANTSIVSVVQGYLSLKRNGKKGTYVGLCPFHGEDTPSFTVHEEGYFKCFGCGAKGDVIEFVKNIEGCSFTEACAKLGATVDKPQESKPKPGQSVPASGLEEECRYPYLDESGRELFTVVRFKPDESGKKTFRQCRKDKDGKPVWNLQGVRRILWQLHLIKGWIAEGRTIYVCEGEKDVLSAMKAGVAATCNPMGAGKWVDEYAEQLRGAKHVVIVQDRDDVGRAHAEVVYQSLVGLVECVDIVESRKGKDLTDHLEAGLAIDDLHTIKAGVRWVTLSSVKPAEIKWLWYPFLSPGKFSLIQGDPGVGKSTVTRAVAAAITVGRGLPGAADEEFEPGDVIYLNSEEGAEDTIAPAFAAMGADMDRIHLVDKGRIALDHQGVRLLEQKISKSPVKLIIADPLIELFRAGTDVHRQNEVRDVMKAVVDLARRTGVVFWGLIHMNKSSGGKAIYKAIGSIDFPAIARTAAMCGADPNDPDRRAVALYKSNIGPTGIAWGYTIEADGKFFWTQQSDLTADMMLEVPVDRVQRENDKEAAQWLRANLSSGPKMQSWLVDEAKLYGLSEKSLRRAKTTINAIAKPMPRPGERGAGVWYWAESYESWLTFTKRTSRREEATEEVVKEVQEELF